MKRFLFLSLVISSLVFTACQRDLPLIETVDIGEQGIIKGQFGEQLEKKTIRMFNVDGDLYYDSGLVSKNTPRCGTMDGNLKKAVAETEIPHKSGDSNFEVEGYQHATSITKEVNIDGQWVIFKKYDTYGRTLEGLKYCCYIKGRLKNAAVDSEMIVLSQNEDVTFNDIYDPLLSSQLIIKDDIGKTLFNPILNDKWGIYLYADDVTSTGLTLQIEQFGGNPSGQLQTGAEYFLETIVDDEWQLVETIIGHPLVWNSVAYAIEKNDITEIKIDWQYGYGRLKSGFYRLKKEIMDFRSAKDYDKETYELYFSVQ